MPLKTMADSSCTAITPVGLGVITAVPSGTTNGSPLGGAVLPPAFVVGVSFFLAQNDSVTFAIESSQPGSAPSPTITISNANADTTRWDEVLSIGMNIYITAQSGSPKFRFI